MSDCNEGNGEPAAEEDDEEGGQSEAVVDTERQVLKEDKGELQGGKINNELKTCIYIQFWMPMANSKLLNKNPIPWITDLC